MKKWLCFMVLAAAAWCQAGCLRLTDEPPFFENGASCLKDSECRPESTCEFDVVAGQETCRIRGGCGAYTDCLSDQACVAGTCLVAECTTTASAACGRYTCDTLSRQCVDSCAGDEQCASGNVCRDGECLSGTCTLQTEARVCEGAICFDGACDDPFDCSDYGCAPGYACKVVRCVKPCASDTECERYVCSSSGECRTDCYSEADCRSGYSCKDRFCQPVAG